MRPPCRATRPGSVLPTLGVCLIALFGFVALAVDLGILAVSRTQCQNAADVASLVGARNLNNQDGTTDTNRSAALAQARAAAKNNPHLSRYVADAEITAVVAGQYKYDPTTQRFAVSYPGTVPNGESWSAVKVDMAAALPTYFMRVMGVTTMPTGAHAVAVHRPRDIAFALDFTGSMGYGSTLNWPYMTDPVEGIMNPDPAYPKFGHYARYVFYQTSSPSSAAAGSATISSRPNPLQNKGFIQDTSGGYAPANHTMTTGGGPPIIEDFLTAPGDPTSVGQATPVRNAFKMWSPAQTAPADTTTLTPATYNWAGYNAATAACPAPDNFDTQADSPVPYVGDKWPRADGTRGGQSGAWSALGSNTFTDQGVYTLKQFLNSTASGPRDLKVYTLPATTGLPAWYAAHLPAGGVTADRLVPNANTVDGGTTDANSFDAIWENYGYDLDVSSLRGGSKAVKLVTAGRFQGYSMGPGYWGKTFFVWPPDPRFEPTANLANPDPANPAFDAAGKPMCDWRRRFFLRGDGAMFDPRTDDINAILFRTTAGHTLNAVVTTVAGSFTANNCPGYYRLNYPAIVAWLKSGPQALPTNLRSGRILYYSTLPADLTTGAAGDSNDKMFWREYVHFLLGVGTFDPVNAPLSSTWNYSPTGMLAGVESRAPFGPLSVTPAAQFDPDGTGPLPANPKPYMCYTDNVNRPRMHCWFGPQTMLQFLKVAGELRPWWSGTTHESQCWQLKAAVSSVLDDIRRNHPSDYCGIAAFATRDNFNTPLAPMGQDWYTLKNVLFFRKDAVADMRVNLVPGSNPQQTTSKAEARPYDASFLNNTASIPNGKGSTDPNSGLAVAFNMLSGSPTLLATGNYGVGGRRGATKIVIFETDGVPNTTGKWFLTGTGADTRYEYNATGGTPDAWTADGTAISTQARYAVKVVERIVAPVSSSGTSGFSLPNAPARVYAIAFGDIFNGYDGTNYSSLGAAQGALRFLLRVQQVGNTSPGVAGTADPPAAGIPVEQVITGPYDVRIGKLKSALERIAQSGVQVTLIE